jgi:hypothetical protein
VIVSRKKQVMDDGCWCKAWDPCCGVYSVVIGDHVGVKQQRQKINNNVKIMRIVLAAK